MKFIRPFIACFILVIFGVGTSRAQENSLYHFSGNLQHYSQTGNVVNCRLTNGAVKIAYLKGIGFRIRYSFSGQFKPLFSYATVDTLPRETPIKITNDGSALVLKSGNEILHIQKKPFRITYQNSAGQTFMKDWFGAGHQGDKIAHIVKRPKGSVYYGLGERPDNLDRSGKRYVLWNTDHPGYPRGTEPLYESYPFYIGLHNDKAYGVYYDNSYKSMFDFGGQLKTGLGYYAAGGELRFYVFYGPSIKKVLQEYTRLTGRAPLPPKWALGYQQSRWTYYPAKELYRLKDQFRSRNIPCDVFYLDIDHMRGYRDFTWDKNYFPHPKQMLDSLRNDGIKVVTILDPGIKKDSTYSVYNEGLKKNAYVKYPDGTNYTGTVWPGKVAFPDFSNPKARNWWGGLVGNWHREGVAGMWIDMNEPSVFGGKTMPYITQFDKDGHKASEYEMHNEYGLLEAKATYNGLKKANPNRRPFIVSRAGFSGIQRYAAIWTGDNTARWQDVALTMPMVMGTGLAGEPFVGFDIGGFNGSPTGQMYMRFLQIGVLMPFCRTHSSKGTVTQEPWDYGHMYTYINKKLIQLRYKLLPDLYTAFYEHTQTGAPVVRPLVWAYQDDPNTYHINDQFMLGDHLMAAPVIHKNKNSRKLYLPKGTWYEFFNNTKYEGGKTIKVSAPIDAVDTYNKVYTHPYAGLPMFVQAGAVIPMQKVQQYVGQKDITNMNLRVYAGGSRKSKLYEDDGVSQDYHHGDYRLTDFQTQSNASTLDVNVSMKGSYSGAVKTFTWQIYGLNKRPKSIEAKGNQIKFNYDEKNHIVTFKTDAKPMKVKINK
ncbi:MAG TPA: glycoside hydrolase family 31 protein [Balneolaceae bacterium]|nr:glycoside hydrolase family 31 protein [Balneolaceae bacterium]